MKRKVLLIIGEGDLLFPGNYSFKTEKMIKKLKSMDDVELVVVEKNSSNPFNLDELRSEIDKLNPEQELTVIIQSHGSYNFDKGFEFILDKNIRVSSKELFTAIGSKVTDKPVDVFTTACYGGGILDDKELLPVGSTLVGLTDATEENNNGDFRELQEVFDSFKGEVTAYNLLQFYLAKGLKNRFNPHIGITGNDNYSLDDLLKEKISTTIDFDYSHFESLGSTEKYKQVFNKIITGKSEYDIFAVEYGIALSIILNDLNNSGALAVSKEDGIGSK